MLTIIFAILLIAVVIRIVLFALKAAWGITKIVFTIVLFPVIMIALAVSGLIPVAIGILLIICGVSLIKGALT